MIGTTFIQALPRLGDLAIWDLRFQGLSDAVPGYKAKSLKCNLMRKLIKT